MVGFKSVTEHRTHRTDNKITVDKSGRVWLTKVMASPVSTFKWSICLTNLVTSELTKVVRLTTLVDMN